MRVESQPRQHSKRLHLLLGLVLLVALLLVHHWLTDLSLFPEAWDVQLRVPIDAFKQWANRNQTVHPIFLYFFDPISDAFDFALRRVETFLLWLPWPVLVAAVFLLAQKAANLRLALLVTFCLLFMGLVGLWPESMQTLAFRWASGQRAMRKWNRGYGRSSTPCKRCPPLST